MLFFDKELSGNRDIACSTCHLPARRTGDGLSLPIGAGGVGLGPARQLGAGGVFIPRHAPELFNRGAAAWRTLFWDGRLSGTAERGFNSPAGNQLPEHLETILAAQAMFPVTSREEMRGRSGDRDIFGAPNELALLDDADFTGIWAGLMVRLLNNSEYVRLFNAACAATTPANSGRSCKIPFKMMRRPSPPFWPISTRWSKRPSASQMKRLATWSRSSTG